jgi:hypothetical protein
MVTKFYESEPVHLANHSMLVSPVKHATPYPCYPVRQLSEQVRFNGRTYIKIQRKIQPWGHDVKSQLKYKHIIGTYLYVTEADSSVPNFQLRPKHFGRNKSWILVYFCPLMFPPIG